MDIILILIALAIGFTIGFLLSGNEKARLKTQNEMMQQNADKTEAEHAKRISEIELRCNKQIEQMREQSEQMINQQRQQMEQHLKLAREQMVNETAKLMKEKSEQLSSANQTQLSEILNPLRNDIAQMKETVDKSGREQSTTMERLDASIKANMEQANELSARADKLAQALIGDNNKTQGDFGELRLKQILEDMGLEEGIQFEEQVTMKDANGNTIHEEEDGHRLIPDVILHFPDERDVVIDSKMSLTAYVDYQSAETEDERQNALKRHIASVRSHVNELSRKNYSKYLREGRGKLDFVLMYVFQESALQLALANDSTLWKEAYDKGVIISGSQNLYMMLRVLEMTWKQVRQVENQQNIIECANTIVDRVQMFYERFIKAEEQLSKTCEAFEDVKKSTAPSGKSITVAANKLLKYGVQENPKRKYKLSSSADEAAMLEE